MFGILIFIHIVLNNGPNGKKGISCKLAKGSRPDRSGQLDCPGKRELECRFVSANTNNSNRYYTVYMTIPKFGKTLLQQKKWGGTGP